VIAGSSTLHAQLRPGERVLWEGRPDVRAYSLRGAWYLIPFSLLWGGFAIFWEATALTSRAGLFFTLWGIPFVLFGLYLIFGRLLVARREAMRTVYAVTDRRILIESGAFRPRFAEIDLRDMPGSQLEVRSDGIGTITLGPTLGIRLPPGWPAGGIYARTPALESIPSASRVYEILQDARSELTTPRDRPSPT
jgi:hypothetical protein